jgi:hypothetical protein
VKRNLDRFSLQRRARFREGMGNGPASRIIRSKDRNHESKERTSMRILPKITSLAAITLALLCQTGLAAPQPASHCQNVFFEGSAPLAVIEVAPGVFTLGVPPIPTMLGNVPGMLGSVVTSLQASGAKAQGVQHITLVHTFESTDPARPGTFTTEDRAVCAPAGKDSAVCRVNDVLTIVSGTGIFANAEGSLRNHGIIDLASFSLTISLRGRVCGDGL